MRIWLLKIGEPIPTDEANPRLLRMGIVADMLIKQGHEVVWWTSTFNHAEKKSRAKSHQTLKVSDSYTVKLIHALPYMKRISWQRLLNHFLTGKRFAKLALKEPPPDIILSAMPAITLSNEAVKYANKREIPVVLDLRDMWPDIFYHRGPKLIRPFVRLACLPMRQMLANACKNATALFGITHKFVEWGLGYAGRKANNLDKAFPLAYFESQQESSLAQEAIAFWRQCGLKEGDFIACFIGTFRSQMELEVVIEAAKMLGSSCKFVLAGSGDDFARYKQLAEGVDNIILPGWIKAPQITALMKISSVGLAPYKSTFDFMASIPNKPIEYFSMGLPVISSLKGELKGLLVDRGCGFTYANEGVGELVSAIERLILNHELRASMAAAAKATYRACFVAEKVYSDMISQLVRISAGAREGFGEQT
jgi:glycosyltransferase involved in cell wall biosynthesis